MNVAISPAGGFSRACLYCFILGLYVLAHRALAAPPLVDPDAPCGEAAVSLPAVAAASGESHLDDLGRKPAGSYPYQLCTSDDAVCSDPLGFDF